MSRPLVTLLLIVAACSFFPGRLYAQVPPKIQWQKCLGGSGDDLAVSIQQTKDGGYIIAGSSSSTNGDVTGNHGNEDFWIVKITSGGSIDWQRSLGGSGSDAAWSIRQTFDNGYIVAGTTNSNDSDVSGNHGGNDCWVVKLSSGGNIQWQKTLGGSGSDEANSIQQTADSGYILVGSTSSNNGDVFGNHGKYDYWAVKLSDTGGILWQKTLGGSEVDRATSVQQAIDGGYIVAGTSNSNDKQITGHHFFYDYWVVKLSSIGNIEWEKSLGGSGDDDATSVCQTSDGGYVVTGRSNSIDGDFTGNIGSYDIWIVKLSSTGDIQWKKFYGGFGLDNATGIRQTADGGYIICAQSNSDDGYLTTNHGGDDYWIVKLSANGDILWQKSFGGSNTIDEATAICQTADGGYIIAGYSGSNDWDVSGNQGGADFWIVKLDAESSVSPTTGNIAISLTPNPTTGNISIKGAGMANIKAYNTMGQLIKEVTCTNHISISDFPSGMYFIQLFNETGEMMYADKIIKQ
jgi:Secretion system C-terminal sorting domain